MVPIALLPVIWALNGVAAATCGDRLRPPSESEAIHRRRAAADRASMRSRPGRIAERLDLVDRTLRLRQRVARDLMVSGRTSSISGSTRRPRSAAKRPREPAQPLSGGERTSITSLASFTCATFPRPAWIPHAAELLALLRGPLTCHETMSAEGRAAESGARARPSRSWWTSMAAPPAGDRRDLVAPSWARCTDEHSRERPSIQRLSSGGSGGSPHPVADFAHHSASRSGGSAATVGRPGDREAPPDPLSATSLPRLRQADGRGEWTVRNRVALGGARRGG